jgi:hypothetical protein
MGEQMGGAYKPSFVTAHRVARFLRVQVWDLPKVAAHYQEEAVVILRAEYEARYALGERRKCSPSNIVLPEY